MSRCIITCMAPGCKNQISYDPDKDEYVHLYCPTHRSDTGRHSAVRHLKKVKNLPGDAIDAPDSIVVVRCPRCHLRREVSERTWKQDVPVVCECGRSMLYHKTIGDEHVGGGSQ